MKYISCIWLLLMLAFLSCKKENLCDCVKSNGKINTIYHDVSGFNCISTKDKMDVYISQGNAYEVKVEAGSNLQKLIRTELDGETLRVHNDNKCNWVRGYKERIKVYITAPYYKYLKNDGVGTIESIGVITQDTLTVRIENSGSINLNIDVKQFSGSTHGNGDLYLKGYTNYFNYNFTGTNYIYADELLVRNYIYLYQNSIGSAYVAAPENGLLDVVINTSGNVFYKGNPSVINLTRNNKGELIKD